MNCPAPVTNDCCASMFRIRFRPRGAAVVRYGGRSEEHTSELQSRVDLVCRLLLEKKKREITRRGSTWWGSMVATGCSRSGCVWHIWTTPAAFTRRGSTTARSAASEGSTLEDRPSQ